MYGAEHPGQIVRSDDADTEKPHYYYQQQPDTRNHFMIICDEGWRSNIVCTGMYEWAAQWLVEQLQGKPYAPNTRP